MVKWKYLSNHNNNDKLKYNLKYRQQSTSNIVSNKVGYLGRFFGLGKNAENNIAGGIAMIFAVAISSKWIFCGVEPPNSFITLLSTIVAYLLAYRNSRGDKY